MARHGAASRIAFAALAGIGLVALSVWIYRKPAAPPVTPKDNAMLPTDHGPQGASGAGNPGHGVVAQIEQQQPHTTMTHGDTSTQPALPADELFTKAAALKQKGDILAARDLINNAMANNQLPPDDLDSAKQFVGELNQRIILGPELFANDPWNKSIKVEAGFAASKFAKRFDMTAEMFGRINNIDPHKIRAGKTYKLIQGPFHLVVSKSHYTADVYLGAPGGPGSMYVKSFRVGLGMDDRTPTGTWKVATGKVVNPVYYGDKGVVAADDPENPLGERWVPLEGLDGDALGRQGFGVHGTIKPESIGKNESNGCIRLLSEDINVVYDMMIEEKSKVVVAP